MQDHIVPAWFWTVGNAIDTGAALAVSAYGWICGGRVQRIAAGTYGGIWIVNLLWLCLPLIPFIPRFETPWLVSWFWDMALATVFLYLALRHHDRWMATAAAAQGVQMGVRAALLIVGEFGTAFDLGMSLAIYAMSAVMMGCILGSTISHQRRTARAKLQTEPSTVSSPRPPLFRWRPILGRRAPA